MVRHSRGRPPRRVRPVTSREVRSIRFAPTCNEPSARADTIFIVKCSWCRTSSLDDQCGALILTHRFMGLAQ